MGYSRLEYPFAGGVQDFSVNFALDFLDREDVSVYVLGELDSFGDQLFRSFTWLNDGTIRVTDPLPNPSTVIVQRTVDKDQLEIDLENTGTVTRLTISRAFRQLMMNIHELLDGRVDSFSGAILDSITSLRNDTVLAKNAAEQSANDALQNSNTAQSAAQTATGASSIAFNASVSAAANAQAAEASRQEALGHSNDAQSAATSAQTAANTATSAVASIGSSVADAQAARDEAQQNASLSNDNRLASQSFSIQSGSARDAARLARDEAVAAVSSAIPKNIADRFGRMLYSTGDSVWSTVSSRVFGRAWLNTAAVEDARDLMGNYSTEAAFLLDSTVHPTGRILTVYETGMVIRVVAPGAGNRPNHPISGIGLDVQPIDGQYNPEHFGAQVDGLSNDAIAVQRAIDAASVTGAEVFMRAGNWVFGSQVILKTGVTLLGAGRHFDANTFELSGTVIRVSWGSGTGSSEDHTKAAVIMHPASKVRSLAFDYPTQDPTLAAPIEYGATIKFYLDADGATTPYHSQCHVEDVLFYKSYTAIDARGSLSRSIGFSRITTHRYTDILMVALRYGVRVDTVTDWTFFHQVEQQPGIISHHSTVGASLRDYVQKNCVFLDFAGTMDWVHLTSCTCWATRIGVIIDGVQGPVTFVTCDFDAARIPVFLRGQSTRSNIKFKGCTFTAFDVNQQNLGVDRFSSFVAVADPNTTVYGLMFDGCYLFGPSRGWGWFGNPSCDIRRIHLVNCVTDVANVEGGPAQALILFNSTNDVIISNNFLSGLLGTHAGNPSNIVVSGNI